MDDFVGRLAQHDYASRTRSVFGFRPESTFPDRAPLFLSMYILCRTHLLLVHRYQCRPNPPRLRTPGCHARSRICSVLKLEA